jgi:hypothetical protein
MFSHEKAKSILNNGSEKFTDEETTQIQSFLELLVEIALQTTTEDEERSPNGQSKL